MKKKLIEVALPLEAINKASAREKSIRHEVVAALKAAELPEDKDPATDVRFAHWEAVHHLIRALESGGESAAAEVVVKLGSRAETARELTYRLYTTSERKKRATEALSYNALVQSFPEITRLAREGGTSRTEQAALFGGDA